MRRRIPALFSFALALLIAPAAVRADTFILKSGEKIEGKITRETDTEYTVDYKVSAGISDTRTILKSELSKVEKVTPDEAAFQAIKSIKPGQNSVQSPAYETALRALQAFADQFPQSPHLAEVTPVIAALTTEKNRVDGGEIKIDSKWIGKDEVQKERYQINGHAILAQMKEVAYRGDLIGALNTFDQLEKGYPGSSSMPDALDLARQLLEKLKASADQSLQTLKIQLKERDTSNQLMSEPQRSQTIAAQKREQQQLDALLDAKGGAKWPALQRHERTLTALSSKAASELKRVSAIPVAKLRQSLQATEQGRAELAKPDLDAAPVSFKQATSLWSTNELAIRLQKEAQATKTVVTKATPVAMATPVVAVRHTPVPVAARATPVGTTVVAPEEPKGFFSTPIGLGAVAAVLLGLGGGYFAYKKKKQAGGENVG